MSRVAVTVDIDWAPDFTIDFVAAILRERSVKATFFVTHASPAIERLRKEPELFELGVHPNFLPGSSHGAAPIDVLRYCLDIVPDARSVRAHALVYSTPIVTEIVEKTPLEVDVSAFMPRQMNLSPFPYYWAKKKLVRVPYFWEDDYEMELDAPLWDAASTLDDGEELRVFDFHPIHLYLNSRTFDAYRRLKLAVPKMASATAAEVDPFVDEGEGPRSAFIGLVDRLARDRNAVHCRELVKGI